MIKRPGKITKMAVGNLFKKPATIVKPSDGQGIEKNYRGKLIFDTSKCIGCKICERDCPSKALEVINEGTKEDKKIKIILDAGRCIFCCQCVDSCPKDCLGFSQDIFLSTLSKDDLKGPLEWK